MVRSSWVIPSPPPDRAGCAVVIFLERIFEGLGKSLFDKPQPSQLRRSPANKVLLLREFEWAAGGKWFGVRRGKSRSESNVASINTRPNLKSKVVRSTLGERVLDFRGRGMYISLKTLAFVALSYFSKNDAAHFGLN
jgi:hypothetical protein